MVKGMTGQEFLFRMLVTDLIRCSNMSVEEKEHMVINFWNQADFYYDIFCESVYMLMTDDSLDSLSLDSSGYSRFDVINFMDDCYPGFELLTRYDIRKDIDDLIVYVDIALDRLKSRLQNVCLFEKKMAEKMIGF